MKMIQNHITGIYGIIIFLIFSCSLFFFGCSDDDGGKRPGSGIPEDGRFDESAITSPAEGYVDSVFINAGGDRIYFLHSKLSPSDFLNGTTNYPQADLLPGHTVGAGLDWNSDLYYVEWDGISWSAPVNMGSAIDGTDVNSLASECCLWLNESETEVIFYRENLGLPALGESGNYISTRPSTSDKWSEPVPLDSVYGTEEQTADRYRHDIHKTGSGDLYLWEYDISYTNEKRLLYGQCAGSSWLDPVSIPGTDSEKDETQPWVSGDELTLIFNRRGADADTSLIRMTREDTSAEWGSESEVSLEGFADDAGLSVWGEPALPESENYMLYIRFDTSQDPWKADIMFAPGTPSGRFGPPVKLN